MEIARRRGDFAIVGVAAMMTLGEGDECTDVRLAFCGVGETPIDASSAAEVLVGGAPTEAAIRDVAASVQRMIDPGGSVHATADYQRHIAGVLTERALRTAHQRVREQRAATEDPKLEGILADEKLIMGIIKNEFKDLKKQYGDERRTKVVVSELGRLSDEDLIADEQVVVTLTAANYIKRSQIAEYKKQGRGGKGKRGMVTREEDVIEHVVNASTHDFLLFFTNRGRVFRLKTYEVPAALLSAKGVALVNLLQLQPEETVSSVINVSKTHNAANLIMCTVRGVVKKTPFEQYQNVRTSGLIAINLDQGDELKWIRMTSGDNEVVISTSQGQAIAKNASSDVRTLVVGNPCNTNALIAMNNAKGIPANQFFAMTMLDENRAKTQLAKKAGVDITAVSNLAIWGNHSATMYPDFANTKINGQSVPDIIKDEAWLQGEFITTVQQRGAAIIKARGASSAASAASSAVDHVRDWALGTNGKWVSMGIPSDGSYGIKPGVVYGYPVTCKDGKYEIVQGLSVDEFSRGKMTATETELREERAAIEELLK